MANVGHSMTHTNNSSWSYFIIDYIKRGHLHHAFDLYRRIEEHHKPIDLNGYAFVALLKACTKMKDLETGVRVHSEVFRTGHLVNDPYVMSSLIDMYLKNGAFLKAEEIFYSVTVQDVIAWTALIAGCTRNGYGQKALDCFKKMQNEGVIPDAVTYICSLKACSLIKCMESGCKIHAQIKSDNTLQGDLVLSTALIDMYAKCGLLNKAKKVFDELVNPTVVTWNALIAGYVAHGHCIEALDHHKKMQLSGVTSDAITFICTLKACATIKAINAGREIHAEIDGRRLLENDTNLGASLVDMYAKCGDLAKASDIFDNLSQKNTITWNALIGGYSEHGYGEEALRLYEKMQYEGICPDLVTFACSLKACGIIGALNSGGKIHAEIARRGLVLKDLVLGNTLVDMYAKSGALTKAAEVLHNLPTRNVVSWNTLIAGYTEHVFSEEALKCFEKMRLEQIEPDGVTIVCMLRACSSMGAIDKGQEIHAEISRKSLLKADPDIANSLIDMYTKLGFLSKAGEVLDMLPTRDNTVTWNSIISGCTKHSRNEQALHLLQQMQHEGVFPDVISYACSLKAIGSIRASHKGLEIHVNIQRERFLESDHLLGTTLIDMYAKCGLLGRAHEVFDELLVRDAIAWNALISGFSENGFSDMSLDCYDYMKFEGVCPNAATFVSCMKACATAMTMEKGLEMHVEILRRGLFCSELVGNTLVDMYAKFGFLAKSQEVFDDLAVRDVVSWTALIAGYTAHGYAEEALDSFQEMQLQGISPNPVTYIFGLKCCANIGAIEKGHEIHAEIERSGLLESNILLGNAVVDMYAKCGSLPIAAGIFEKLPFRGVASYNSLMAGYTLIGETESTFNIYNRMIGENIKPDAITFLIVLNACCQANLFEMGCTHFETMEKIYGVVPSIEHYTCMVDLFSRAGYLEKAIALIKEFPSLPDLVVWHTLLVACKEWGNLEHGRQAFRKALSLDPKGPAAYVLMSNIYGQMT